MSCGCTDPCQPNSIPCTCEARVTSDCVTVSGATSNCLAIDDNLLLTDYLTQMDERICEKVDSVTNFIALENVGTGSQLYKGDSLLGKKQIRTVKSLDTALIVTETVDEIQLDLNIPAIVPPDGTETKLVNGTNTTVAGNGSTATPYSVNVTFPTPPIYDGSETKVIAGTNTTVSGNGTTATPYIINSSGGVTVNQDNFIKYIEIDGNEDFSEFPFPPSRSEIASYLNSLPSINKTIDEYSTYRVGLTFSGASISDFNTGFLPTGYWYGKYYCIFEIINVGKGVLPTITEDNLSLVFYQDILLNNQGSYGVYLNQGNNTTVTGTGSYIDPFIINATTESLQKVITGNTTISNLDNNYVIFINNGSAPITITINASITAPNFGVGFIQEGTGDVTFVGTGVSLTNPVGLKSKGQGYQTFIERKLDTSTYFLLGNTRA